MLIRTLVLAGALLLASCATRGGDPLSQPDAPNLAPYVGGHE